MKKTFFLFGIAILLIAASAGLSYGTDRTVNPAGGAMYLTIGAAVADAAPGDRILCAPGSYPSGATLDKPLTLLGAQAGVDARTGRPGAQESVITGGGLGIFVLNAVGITIDGFKFANMAHRTIDTYFNADNTTIRNCIFAGEVNNYQGGAIQFGGPSTLHAHNFLFERNLMLIDGGYLLYLGHAMDNGTVRDNKFNGDSVSFGPFGNRTGWLIEGNEFDGDVPGYGPYWGCGFNANLGNAVIRGNNVHRMSSGIGNISIVGGSILNNRFADNAYGAFELWGGEFGSVVSADAAITGNTFVYNGMGNSNQGYAIRLRPGTIDPSTIHVRNNCFTNLGLGTSAPIRQLSSIPVDAELNDWGTGDPAKIIALFTGGPADYDPWLTGVSYAGAAVFPASDPVILKASVATSGGPFAGAIVRFYVDAVFAGEATTDAAGLATFDWGTHPAGSYVVEATAAGGCLSSGPVTIAVESSRLKAGLEVLEAKIDWKKKPDDDKIKVVGVFTLPEGAVPEPAKRRPEGRHPLLRPGRPCRPKTAGRSGSTSGMQGHDGHQGHEDRMEGEGSEIRGPYRFRRPGRDERLGESGRDRPPARKHHGDPGRPDGRAQGQMDLQ